jgi:hypothetical protein
VPGNIPLTVNCIVGVGAVDVIAIRVVAFTGLSRIFDCVRKENCATNAPGAARSSCTWLPRILVPRIAYVDVRHGSPPLHKTTEALHGQGPARQGFEATVSRSRQHPKRLKPR